MKKEVCSCAAAGATVTGVARWPRFCRSRPRPWQSSPESSAWPCDVARRVGAAAGKAARVCLRGEQDAERAAVVPRASARHVPHVCHRRGVPFPAEHFGVAAPHHEALVAVRNAPTRGEPAPLVWPWHVHRSAQACRFVERWAHHTCVRSAARATGPAWGRRGAELTALRTPTGAASWGMRHRDATVLVPGRSCRGRRSAAHRS